MDEVDDTRRELPYVRTKWRKWVGVIDLELAEKAYSASGVLLLSDTQVCARARKVDSLPGRHCVISTMQAQLGLKQIVRSPSTKASRIAQQCCAPRQSSWARPASQVRAAASAVPTAMEPLVSPEWLAERLGDPSIRVLDTAWYMPVHKRNNHEDYRAVRIPGARFFDIDGIAADPAAARGLPHMLPSEQGFAAAMDALGISNDTTVVLYDHLGIFSAPRVWWTFKVFGHDKVAVLQGGLPAWRAKGLPLEESSPPADEVMFAGSRACAAPPATTHYKATLDRSKVRSIDDMLANINSRAEQVMDARSAGRFVGTEPEPRPGLRGGHIPGARSLPFPTLLDSGAYKPPAQLAEAFTAAGLDPERPIVGSCGSGLTACILALALYQINGKLAAVYDGSWMEYGARDDVPLSTLPEDP